MEKKTKKKVCEYDSFWDCHANKEYCKKHFRITATRPLSVTIQRKEGETLTT